MGARHCICALARHVSTDLMPPHPTPADALIHTLAHLMRHLMRPMHPHGTTARQCNHHVPPYNTCMQAQPS